MAPKRSLRYRHHGAAYRHKKRRLAKRGLSLPVKLLGVMALFFALIGLASLGHWYFGGGRPMVLTVEVIEREISRVDQLEPITQKQVKPVLYRGAPPLETLTIDEKKRRFIEMILPAVLIAKHNQDVARNRVEAILAKQYPTLEEQRYIRHLLARYRTTKTDILLSRLSTHPTSIVLAQAALESGWGTSRFFKEANNLFGVWSFNPSEPRIAANATRSGRPIFLKRYESPLHSIEDYFKTVGSSRSFEQFRDARLRNSDPFHLIRFLGFYSEQRQLYIDKLHRVVESNNLTEYDNYELDASYLKLKAAP